MRRWDAVVVGAGPAGAIAAYTLAAGGATVLLVDRATFPRRKVCGSCVSPGALSVLREAGLDIVAGGIRRTVLRRLILRSRSRQVALPLEGGGVMERAKLDAQLVREAVRAGATFRDGTAAALGPVIGPARLVRTSGRGTSELHEASFVLDASGLLGLRPEEETDRARLRGPQGRPGRGPRTSRRVRGGVQRGARVGLGATLDDPDLDLAPGDLWMVVGAAGYVGLVRLPDGRVNVGAAVDLPALRRLGPRPLVEAILREAGVVGRAGGADAADWRGTPPLTRRPECVGADRLLRLGDASGYVEPFTGEGICWALETGLAAARLTGRALEAGRSDGLTAGWQAYHRRAVQPARRLCRALTVGLRSPAAVAVGMGLLERVPGLARPLVRGAARRPGSPGRRAR